MDLADIERSNMSCTVVGRHWQSVRNVLYHVNIGSVISGLTVVDRLWEMVQRQLELLCLTEKNYC
jgi:hypothetical protein